ncbi:amino acid permease [Clostridium fermenticellae]|uniref:Amino acid permease n=1 Tax=Clostridium fermenticellae TaxID=2068654 RepID=A0A386H237_9CLOT|nr:amino acid permease [Clostridium fermenticellae]AYD39726.1 amino acid permease [Clostridium fermenticellae]
MASENKVTYEKESLERGLKNRHIQMIAIGGTIGTGLFYGSKDSISAAGPAVLVSFLIAGCIVFLTMRALGEMSVAEPVSGSFSAFAYKYSGKFLGYLSGWTYWLMLVLAAMGEVTASGIYMNFWYPQLPAWLTGFICLLILTIVNLTSVKSFGEFEFWFAAIKVVTILAMIAFGILIIFFGVGHKGIPVGLTNLTAHGGFAPNGFSGILLGLVMATFSFLGVEMIGTTAGESEDVEKSFPKAINNVALRILIFYVGAIFIVVSLFPWNGAATFKGSPFVAVFLQVGIHSAAGIINFVVITAALSGMNSCIYVGSRMVFNLSLQGNAPKFLSSITKKTKTPYASIILISSVVMLAVVANYFVPEKVFGFVTGLAVVAGLTSWATIIYVQIKFRRAKMKNNERIAFKMPWWPYSSYIVFGFIALVLIIMAINPGTRPIIYAAPFWFAFIIIIYIFSINKKNVIKGESKK